MIYIVTFQTNSEASRLKVCERLKTFSAYCPIHNYCWAVSSDKKAAEIVDDVRVALEANERLFVIRSGTEAAWLNTYGEKNSEWLKNNL